MAKESTLPEGLIGIVSPWDALVRFLPLIGIAISGGPSTGTWC